MQTLGFELPKLAALSLLCMGCALVLLLKKTDVISSFTESLAGRLYLAFGVIVMLSLLWSVAPIVSLIGAAPRYQGVLAHVLFLFLGLFAADRMRHASGRRLIISAIACVNIFVVFYGLVQMMHMDPMADYWKLEAFLGRVFSSLGQPNTLGQCIVLTVPFVVLLWFRFQERVVRMALGMLILFNGVVLLGTVSRSAMLGIAAMLFFSLPALSRWMQSAVRKVKTEQAFVLSLVIVLCASIGLLFFAQRFQLTLESGRSASSRAVIWNATGEMIKHRPIGWGIETMAFTSPRFTGKELYNYVSLTTTVDRAHNEPLQVLQSLGPLGLLIYLSLLLTLLLATRTALRRNESGLLRATSFAVLGYIVSAQFGFASIATGAFFWMIVGMHIALLPSSLPPLRIKWVRISSGIFLCIATVTFVVAVRWTQARWIHAYAAMALQSNPSTAIALHQQGVLMFSYDRQSIIEAAELHLLALEKEEVASRDDLISSAQILIDLLRKNTNHQDGMADLLSAWLAAIEGDRVKVD
ncbi:MAG: O-antigen ligase family protein, partial [Candidatus Peribacteraceae bacterium]|nr:O-antigen ligase family protein [Candidatus Peribacteraceae bacterium]